MPSYIQVPTGAKITWVSKDTISHWPASDFHPTHGRYPSKEKGCIGSALDACRGVEVVDNILFSKISAAAGRFSWWIRNGLSASMYLLMSLEIKHTGSMALRLSPFAIVVCLTADVLMALENR